MRIKSILAVSVLVFSLWFQTGQAKAADSQVFVTIDGKVQKFSQPPVIVDDYTLVPLRGIFEALGAKVYWDEATQTVNAYKDGTEISLTIGSKQVYKDKKAFQLDVPAQIINETTMVPVRFIGESLGSLVKWDEDTQTVMIQSVAKGTAAAGAKLTVEDIGKLQDRVVYIEVYDAGGELLGNASGFVVSSDGGIITNYHVVDEGASLKVEFPDHTTYTTSQIVKEDPEKDLALIKINASKLPTAAFGDSSKVKLGEDVVAIGSPLGLKNTLSTGVVSTVDRKLGAQSYIQITAPIDHGSSGGALFNMYGEVIGVTSAGISSQASLNLAIPSNTVTTFLQQPDKPRDMKLTAKKTTFTDPNELAAALKDDFGYYSHNGLTLHFDIYAYRTKSGHYDVDLVIRDIDELYDLRDYDYQQKGSFIPALLTVVAKKTSALTGDTLPLTAIWLDYNHGTKYPSAFPSDSIEVNDDGTYQIVYEEAEVLIDTEKKEVIYYPSPTEDSSMSRTMPLP